MFGNSLTPSTTLSLQFGGLGHQLRGGRFQGDFLGEAQHDGPSCPARKANHSSDGVLGNTLAVRADFTAARLALEHRLEHIRQKLDERIDVLDVADMPDRICRM